MALVAAPLNFRGDLKISYQNNWGGPEQKIKFGGAGAKILGGAISIVGKGGIPPLV